MAILITVAKNIAKHYKCEQIVGFVISLLFLALTCKSNTSSTKSSAITTETTIQETLTASSPPTTFSQNTYYKKLNYFLYLAPGFVGNFCVYDATMDTCIDLDKLVYKLVRKYYVDGPKCEDCRFYQLLYYDDGYLGINSIEIHDIKLMDRIDKILNSCNLERNNSTVTK